MPAFPTPALDLILNLADKSAAGRLALSGSRVVAAPGSSSYRIVRADDGLASVRACVPNLSGERAFDDVDLSISTVQVALGIPGQNPFCLATLATPFPSAASAISAVQSATADLPATKRITLDPAPYAGSFIVTLDANDPFEIPFDAEPDQIQSLAGPNYSVKKRAANAWEISGTKPNQDVTIAVDVTGLRVPLGVTGPIALNTVALADYFTAQGNPKWVRLTLEVDIDGVKVYQNDKVEIARELLNLSTLVPTPIPPSDFATLSAQIAGKQPINSQLTAISALATTSWGRALLALTDAAALRTYASLQPLSAQLTALAALAGAAYGRGLLTQSNSAALRTYIEATFANLPDKPNTIAGYGIGDYNSLGDARWSPLAHAARHAAAGADPLTLDQSQITNLTSDLATKAPLSSPALTGTPTAPTPVNATSSTQLATTAFVHALFTDLLNAPPATLDTLKELADAIGDDPNFAVTVANSVATKLAKASNLSDLTDAAAARVNLALGNVDNTSDANKPVSTAQAAANAVISAALATHSARTDNPHAVTKSQVGLANADNTSDANKPVSTAQQTALDLKAALAANNTFTGTNIFTLLQTFNAIAASSIVLSQLANPGVPTVTPIGSDEGATWSYKIVAKLSDGTPSAAGPAGTTTHGDQTLDATNKNSLAWTAVPGAASYDVYRTAVGISPATTGKIANVATNAYIDTGAAGDSATPPINNTTGRVLAALHDKGGALYNARAYGVLGDGVTDDSPAIAALVALVPQGAHIFFPAATYRLASAITISKALTISGAGTDFGGTQFVCDSTASGFIVASNTNYVVFRNFRLQSYARALAITGPVGITAIAADLAHSIGYLRISDVIVNGFDTGVDFRYCQMGALSNLTVEANKLGLYQKRSVNMAYYGLAASLNTSWGVFLDGDAGFVQQSSGTRLISPILVGNGATAAGNLKLLYQDQVLIVGGMIDVPAAGHVVNVRVEGCTGGTLSASYVGSAFTGPGVILQASDGFGLVNDKIIGNQYGIRLISSSRCKINSCEFKAQPGYDVWINDEAGTGSTGNIVNGNSLGSAATTDPSIFEQNTNHTLVRDNVISGTIVVSNPELARGNYNYVTFLSADPVIWIAPALASSWVNYGAGETGAGYYLDADGWVHLQGTIKDGTTTGNAILFVLPAGYRPTGNRRFVVANNAAAGFIAVNTAGEVRINSGTNTMLSLEGIRFRNN